MGSFCTTEKVIVRRGVILMRLEHSGKVQSASLISAAENEPEMQHEVEMYFCER